ncbi:MAG: hypothetical protein JSW40_09480 [Candidatus Omnitrophota bacterium]|nr:MAG: hypothetical protein JSW40_09480 [Candidatus Omnitrophota bacterium]
MKITKIGTDRLIVTDPGIGTYIGGIIAILGSFVFGYIGFYKESNFTEFTIFFRAFSIGLFSLGIALFTTRRYTFYRNLSRCEWVIRYCGVFPSTGNEMITDIDCETRESRYRFAYRLILRNVNMKADTITKAFKKTLGRKGCQIGALGKIDNDKERAIQIAKEIAEFAGVNAWDPDKNLIYAPKNN